MVDGQKSAQATRCQTSEIQYSYQKRVRRRRQNGSQAAAAKPRQQVKGAYRTVVDTIKGTDQLHI
jgi:hypothetical protein